MLRRLMREYWDLESRDDEEKESKLETEWEIIDLHNFCTRSLKLVGITRKTNESGEFCNVYFSCILGGIYLPINPRPWYFSDCSESLMSE